jgi:hypothetical protein
VSYYENSYHKKDDLLNVVKNTRARHTLPKAVKGKNYLVISHYTNKLGTTKYIVLDEEGTEHFTTENAVRKVSDFTLGQSAVWQRAKKVWMDRTYVPVFGVHTYDYVGMPFVSSRDGNSRLIKPLFSSDKDNSGVWIHKSRVHDDDVKLFMSSSFSPDSTKKGMISETVTFRVPVWFAEKNGLFNGSKSK